MKKLSPRQWAVILYESTVALQDRGAIESAVRAFAVLIRKHRALRQMDRIITAFTEYAEEKDGTVALSVKSARPLTPSVTKIVQNVFGKAVIKKSVVDEHLIGGISIQTKDMLFDSTVRTQLDRLSANLLG